MPDHCYQAVGGMEGCRKLSEVFYGYVAQDPVLRPIFKGGFHCAIEALALYLAQFLGGPCEYAQRRWWLSLREAHLRFKIGEKERRAWLKNMRRALGDVKIESSAATLLMEFFEQSSAGLVNQPKPADLPTRQPIAAAADGFSKELEGYADAQDTLERAVEAVRKGDAECAISLVCGPALQNHFNRNRADLASFLALMMTSRDVRLIKFTRDTLSRDTALAKQQYSLGRTLLHEAAAAGNVDMTALLLELGANPNGETGRPPLYCVGNECVEDSGAAIVRMLVESGADVNARENLKKCTALHMAARRGNVAVAKALLDSGADIEARDSTGDSPLRRAVNCAKPEVAALLLARGADPDTIGSKHLTPRQAARSARMKQIFST